MLAVFSAIASFAGSRSLGDCKTSSCWLLEGVELRPQPSDPAEGVWHRERLRRIGDVRDGKRLSRIDVRLELDELERVQRADPLHESRRAASARIAGRNDLVEAGENQV